MNDPASAIGEVGRVLEPGGVFCIAIVHPLNRSGEAREDYFRERPFTDVVARRGLEMAFAGIDRPLESYVDALAAAGFVIERLREPRAAPADVARSPELEPAARRPFFLHLQCRLRG